MAPKQYLDDDGEPVGKGSGITPPSGYSLLSSKKSDKPKKTVKGPEIRGCEENSSSHPEGLPINQISSPRSVLRGRRQSV